MASDLREALEEIASESRPASPSTDLWRRGRRRHRLQATGGVIAAAGLMLASGGLALGLDATRDAEPPVADVPTVGLRLPDRVYNPSEWTKAGRVVGPIAVAFSATRGTWSGGEHGIMTVSAVDGGYRFIDVPGLDRLEGMQGEWALSPGGRYVAWWEPSAGPQVFDAVSAVHVYDAVTGKVIDQEQPKVDGLPVARGNLAWLDADTVVFNVAAVEEKATETSVGYTPRALPAQVWDVSQDSVHDTARVRWSVQPPRLLSISSGRSTQVDPKTGADTPFPRTPRALLAASVSPSGLRFAGLDHLNIDGRPNPDGRALVWGDLVEDGRPRARPTGVVGVDRIVAWLDDDRVVGLFAAGTRQPRLEVVGLPSGDTSPYLSFEEFLGDNLQIASGLVVHPTVPGVRPPGVWDPRLPGIAGGLVLLAAAAWFLRGRWVSRWR